jgi:hypothetical protein
MNTELLQRVRDGLPRRLNAGILMGDGGFCVLGWMLLSAGFHPITLYANTIGVVDPGVGGPAIDVVARVFDLPRDDVVALARLNDTTPRAERTKAVRARLDELLTRDGRAGVPRRAAADGSGADRPVRRRGSTAESWSSRRSSVKG